MLNDNRTNGYVIFDLLGVDLTTASQNITGIYKRVKDVFEADKPIIMAVDNIPPFAVTAKKISNYYELVSEFYVFDINTNDILIIRPNSGTFTEVTITPSLLSGTKIADYSVGDTSGSLYAPEQQTEINDSTASDHTTYSSDKINTLLSGKADTGDIPVLTDLIDDTSTAEDKVWSAYKTDGVSNMAIQNDENIGYLSDDLAPRFDLSANYAVGDYCLYNKILYRFTSAKSAGAWDSTKVTSVKVGTELKSLKNYSTTETAIGTWTDGKTIYRKVLNGNFGTSSYVDIDSGVEIDTVVSVSITVIMGSIVFIAPCRSEVSANEYYQLYPFVMLRTSGNTALVRVNSSSSNSSYYNNSDIQVIIEYTKR